MIRGAAGSGAPVGGRADAGAAPRTVILVHGIWMTGDDLRLLRRRLGRGGRRCRIFRYASLRRSPADNARRLRAVAESGSRFVSRGDKSGTHNLELALWKQAGVEPKGGWYIESGQGMGQTLGIANERAGYTITDRATYLAFQKRINLPVLVEKDRPLLNIYSVMEVNPANGPRVNAAGGKAFADFMLAPETQAVIKTFGVDKYGQPLFVPIAGTKSEEEVGG